MKSALKDGNPRAAFRVLVLIITAAAVIRVLYLVQLSGSDLNWLLPLDMRFYRDIALEISQRGFEGAPEGPLSFNPLYPAFLALIFKLIGKGLLAPRIIQSMLGVLTVYTHFLAGREVARGYRKAEFDAELTGVIAAAMALLYPHFLLYEGSFLGTSLVTLLMVVSFYFAAYLKNRITAEVSSSGPAGRSNPFLVSLALGFLMGLGALGRPNLFLLLIPLIAVWFFFQNGRVISGRWVAGAVIAGSLAVLSVPIAYNAARSGRFIPVTSHGGINFYIGNSLKSKGVYSPPQGMRGDMRGLVEDARKIAERRTGRKMSDEQASSYWLGRAVQDIREEPAGWLKLLGRKFVLFWNKAEIPDVIDLTFYRDSCPVMKLLFIPFSLISVLALGGLAVVWRIKTQRPVIYIFVVCALLSVMLFYINSRYRIPSVPVMIVSASVFLVWISGRIKNRQWKPAVLALIAAVLLFFLVADRDMVRVNRGAMYAFLGNRYMEKEEEAKAMDAFKKAYLLDPANPEAQINYARILAKYGKLDKATGLYASAFRSFPDFPRLAIEYGVVLERMGRREEAVRLYRYTYQTQGPRERLMACRYLSRSALAEGKREESMFWIRKAIEIAPGDRELLKMLDKLEGP